MEEHGPHLPTGTESIRLMKSVCRQQKKQVFVITPLVWFGNSRSLMDFPGTNYSQSGFPQDVCARRLLSLVKHGFDRPIILDGHGGNYGIFDILIEDIMLEHQLKPSMCGLGTCNIAQACRCAALRWTRWFLETSAMLHLCPEDVDTHRFSDSKPEIELTRYGSDIPSPSGIIFQRAG